jgi:hypothetical protein
MGSELNLSLLVSPLVVPERRLFLVVLRNNLAAGHCPCPAAAPWQVDTVLTGN